MNISRIRTSLLLCAAFIVCMAPFLGKAAHIDDPLFLWSAEHILQNPLDFYGFCVNWYGWDMPMWEVMKNPPLTSYYLAALFALGGRSLLWLHAGMLLPSALAVLGTYRLAGRLCCNAWLATLLTIFSAPFFLASGSFMAEPLLMALWVWAVYLWVRGEQEDHAILLALGAVIAGFAILAKYNALALLPLLLAFSLVHSRRVRMRTCWLLVPVLMALLYEWSTAAIYGHGLLSSAMGYSLLHGSMASRGIASLPRSILTGLAFLGGGLLGCSLLAPAAWGRRWIWLILLAASVLLVSIAVGGYCGVDYATIGNLRWFIAVQAGILIAGGVSLLGAPLYESIRTPDAETLLLSLWIWGQFIFAACINWTINSRSILPLIPAAAILVVRMLERRMPTDGRGVTRQWSPAWIIPVLVAGGLTIALAWCDMRWANAGRDFAENLDQYLETKAPDFSGSVFFAGHWGFQYAMQDQGFKPLDHHCSTVRQGDILILPLGMLQKPIPLQYFGKKGVIDYPGCSWLALQHTDRLSGFYSSVFGPLPFVLAPTGPHRFRIYQARNTLNFSPCTPCEAGPIHPHRESPRQ
ncbi:ArnT family glycosyltransferase [Oceanidesulfovibrio marinus]|uniref:Glycosyltransferase RgtA/B/C/D-like domain-containing protein n=1 Tax=Oceanidesulfovibrio marinus TaxID=370038 RepID=A0A6P1ZFH4_9BACT|nr:glycosyltransferase family 39 protein [Oceanidesulfovibrio marinus]TVM33158.1 hypothetical protein DQK91_13470 [Oceanidesulfovibrio marinus]